MRSDCERMNDGGKVLQSDLERINGGGQVLRAGCERINNTGQVLRCDRESNLTLIFVKNPLYFQKAFRKC